MDAVNRRLGISIVDQPSVGNPLEFCSSSRNKNFSCVLYLRGIGLDFWIARSFSFFFFFEDSFGNYVFISVLNLKIANCNCNFEERFDRTFGTLLARSEMGFFFEIGRISARLCEIAGIDGSEKVSV